MVVQQGRQFPGRERDVQEVQRYYQALQQMEKWVEGAHGFLHQSHKTWIADQVRKTRSQILASACRPGGKYGLFCVRW